MSDYFLADDLSGALDAAAAFHRAGQAVTIALTAAAWPESAAGVIGLTTETRNASPDTAAAVVAHAIAEGRRRGARLVYKKIDSTLRGPVAAEVAALAEQMPQARILFAPANPAVGRTVRDGVLLVHGVPVAETEFARDPVSPVRESVIHRLLGSAASARVIIADAASEADLAAAVARVVAGGESWVAVGSGALARPVARLRAGDSGPVTGDGKPGPFFPTDAVLPSPDTCLLLCGSAHPRNREQAAVVARERGIGVCELNLSDVPAAVNSAIAGIRTNRGVALLVEERRGDSGAVVQAIAAAAAEIMQATGTRRIFVTGGETAFAVCRALGVSTLEFGAEVESGLSVSRGETPAGAVLLAVKPGGFGDSQTWLRAWDALASL